SANSCVIINSHFSVPSASAARLTVHSFPGKGGLKEFHAPCNETSWRRRCWKVLLSSGTSPTGMPMNTTWPPGAARRVARLIEAGTPAASTIRSHGRSGGASCARNTWVAPASRASSSFAEARSTAATSVHPMSRIHWMAKRPIGPQPTTAPRWPIAGRGFQEIGDGRRDEFGIGAVPAAAEIVVVATAREIARQALIADPARQQRRDADELADLETAHALADIDDLPGEFMAADDRHPMRALGEKARNVRAADADGCHSQEDFALLSIRPRNVLEPDVPRLVHHGGLHE